MTTYDYRIDLKWGEQYPNFDGVPEIIRRDGTDLFLVKRISGGGEELIKLDSSALLDGDANG